MNRALALLCVTACGVFGFGQTTTGTMVVHADQPGHKISPIFYGLMTEEINHSYDGGLYGELIRNRSFRDSTSALVHWSTVTLLEQGVSNGTATLDEGPSLRLAMPSASDSIRVFNDGYWGIPVTPNTTYRCVIDAKCSSDFHGAFSVDLQSADGRNVYCSHSVSGLTAGYRQYSFTLRTGALEASKSNVFQINSKGPGSIWLKYVSLFPPTFHNRPNGNRRDLMELLGQLKPSFLRFPGGNYLEGDRVAQRFEWKDTIGPVDQRPGHQGPWGYRSSDGLGLLEFLEWCEDLKMEPLLAVYAGYSLRQDHIDPGPGLEPFVQDALDEIEYVTGGTDTKWGAERARDGHPKPFPLSYVEIGNEDGFDRRGYDGRFAQFFDAIRSKYPGLKLIATARVTSRTPDMVDDHYYRTGSAMARDADHYSRAPRTGPKIFVGEWASTEGSPTPNFRAALGDAAWLTGLERDSDLVLMESYAPLLVNVNPGAAQWGTNLIGYDALHSFGSPSFFVQSLFAANTGDSVVPAEVSLDDAPDPLKNAPHGLVGVGTWNTQAEFKDIDVTSDGKTLLHEDFMSGSSKWKLLNGQWNVADGVLRQSAEDERCLAIAGDPSWKDYTIQMKARKTGGQEGFLIAFHCTDADNLFWWNVGGWGDTRSAIERVQGSGETLGRPSRTSVETGRWYDVKVEVKGGLVNCYLDGKLVNSASEVDDVRPIYAAVSRSGSGHELDLKVVNVSADDFDLSLDIQGAKRIQPEARGWVLSGEPGDVNTIDAPTKIEPKPLTIHNAARRFSHRFPAHSVTVLRLRE